MRFVHFADLHLNNIQSGRMDGVIPIRVLDVLKNLKRLVDFAIKKDVDYVFFSGDAYKTNKPQNMYRTMFHDEIIRLVENDIKVVMIPGNHDMTRRDGSKHALSEFKHLQVPNVHILDVVEFVEFDDCIVLGIPWQYKLFDIPHPPQTDKPIIALIHATVKGILPMSDTSEMVLGREFIIELEDFSFCDYIGLGHIHKFKVFENPLAIYPSSMACLTWGELGKHGFVYGSFQGKELEWKHIELPTRPRYDLEYFIDSFSPPILPTKVNKDDIYRITLNYVDKIFKQKTNNIEQHFKDVYNLEIRQNSPPKKRSKIDVQQLMKKTDTELLEIHLGDKFDPPTRILWYEMEQEVGYE